MPCLSHLDLSILRQIGLNTFEQDGKLGLGIEEIEVAQGLEIGLQVLNLFSCPYRKIGQDPIFLFFFFSREEIDLIVRSNDLEGLKEDRHPAVGLIVDDPFQLILIVRFDGQNVSSVPQGDELLLKEGLPFFLVEKVFENRLNLFPDSPQLIPDLCKSRTGFIEDLALGTDRVKDLFLEGLLVG